MDKCAFQGAADSLSCARTSRVAQLQTKRAKRLVMQDLGPEMCKFKLISFVSAKTDYHGLKSPAMRGGVFRGRVGLAV